jgi:hypothetical protein
LCCQSELQPFRAGFATATDAAQAEVATKAADACAAVAATFSFGA